MIPPHRTTWCTFAATVYFAAALILAALLWLQIAEPRLPYFANSDQWVITADVIRQPFMAFVMRGHNGVPVYFHNAMTWLDYHWLNYRNNLLQISILLTWAIGTFIFHRLLQRSGANQALARAVTGLVVSLWIADVNSHNIAAPWRAMEATGVWFLFLLALMCSTNVYSIRDPGTSRRQGPRWGWFVGASAIAWLALYFNGGFAVLPIILGLLVYSGRKSKLAVTTAALVLVLFAWHYRQVHTIGTQLSPATLAPWWEPLLAFSTIASALVRDLSTTVMSQSAALALSAVTTLAAIAMATRIALRYITDRATPIETLALALLGYGLILALGIAFIGWRRGWGWEEALTQRYTSYSIYTLTGLILSFARSWQQDIQPRRLHPITMATASAVALLALTAGASSWRHVNLYADWSHREAANIIPYTLNSWSLPEYGYFEGSGGDRRANLARSYHDHLLVHRKFIFSSDEYASAMQPANAELSRKLDACHGRFVVRPPPIPARERTADTVPMRAVAIEWHSPMANQASIMRFHDSRQRVIGWAVGPNSSKGGISMARWIERLLHRSEPVLMQGYLSPPEDNEDIQVVPVGPDGQAICIGSLEEHPG